MPQPQCAYRRYIHTVLLKGSIVHVRNVVESNECAQVNRLCAENACFSYFTWGTNARTDLFEYIFLS